MDAATLILTALTTGGQVLVTDAVKDAYLGLKSLVQKRLEQKPKAQEKWAYFEEDLEAYEKPLKKLLIQEQLDQDSDIIQAAQEVMKFIQPQQAARGKYNVQITGNVQGYAQGDNQTVTMHFSQEPKK